MNGKLYSYTDNAANTLIVYSASIVSFGRAK
jgi:hypothetical protein